MTKIHLGAHGQTIFSWQWSDHIGGTRLQLRGREGSILIGQREIEIIAGLAEILGVECDQATIASLTDKIFGKQMKDIPIASGEIPDSIE